MVIHVNVLHLSFSPAPAPPAHCYVIAENKVHYTYSHLWSSKVISGWLVERQQTVVVWRFVWIVYGELSVMTSGQLLMPMWLADSLGTLDQVS